MCDCRWDWLDLVYVFPLLFEADVLFLPFSYNRRLLCSYDVLSDSYFLPVELSKFEVFIANFHKTSLKCIKTCCHCCRGKEVIAVLVRKIIEGH